MSYAPAVTVATTLQESPFASSRVITAVPTATPLIVRVPELSVAVATAGLDEVTLTVPCAFDTVVVAVEFFVTLFVVSVVLICVE